MAEVDETLRGVLISTAHDLADAARQAIMPHFRMQNLQADNKAVGAFDPVTIADRNAESAMRAILAKRRPDDGILGEEHGVKKGTSGLTVSRSPLRTSLQVT